MVSDYNALTGLRQMFQLRLGIEAIESYEKNNDFSFDYVMKTRFDVVYPKEFYPRNPVNRLTFDDEFLNIDKEKYINFLKNSEFKDPEYIVKMDLWNTIGGPYSYNYIDEEVLNRSMDVVYMLGDWVYFCNRETFGIFKTFFDAWGKHQKTYGIKHVFAPESQFILACKDRDIIPLMYRPRDNYIIRNP
jgi:hypothetical protein